MADRSGRWSWGLLALAVVGVLAVLPGCGPAFQEVLIVGHDDQGTPVVGAVDCALDGREDAEIVSVAVNVEGRPGQEVWRIERPGRGRIVPEGRPPGPPPPSPRSIGGVELVAIGDPEPDGGDVVVALSEPLSDDVVVEAYVYADDYDPIGELLLLRSGAPDTYDLAFGDGGAVSGLDAAAAAVRIDEECRNEGLGFAVAPVLITVAVTFVVLALLSIPLGMATARQFRRAVRRPTG